MAAKPPMVKGGGRLDGRTTAPYQRVKETQSARNRMTDEEFLAALEDLSLDSVEFRHEGHVRAGYLMLRTDDFLAATARMRQALKRYSTSRGRPGMYHETQTVAFMALINERMQVAGDAGGWDAFARAHPDLLDARIIERYYRPETLESDLARRVFLLADRR